jgi:hypothetical protein
MDKWDYGILKDCLKTSVKLSSPLKMWCNSLETVIMVGHILDRECGFEGPGAVFEFIEKPWHWENEMRELVIEYELDKVADDIERMTMDEATEALVWLDKFGFEDKALNALMNDISERELCPC